MRILMLGWEFPPRIAGGLGTACFGLTRALDRLGHQVCFVVPDPRGDGEIGRRPGFALAEFITVPAGFHAPYAGSSRQAGRYGYGNDLAAEAQRYASLVVGAAPGEFDIIHAHDWLTFPAGLALSSLTGRPLVVHVHSTEADRSGGQGAGARGAADVEAMGMRAADRVIAVSSVTRTACIDRYGVDPGRIEVVHNGSGGRICAPAPRRHADRADRVVLFLGRIAAQKGPALFLLAARAVAERVGEDGPPMRFVMAGDGDELDAMKRLAAELGLGGRVEFPGFLRGPEVSRAYARADVFVMTSLAEPFGLTALEAVRQGLPVILPPWAGAVEVIPSASVCRPEDAPELAAAILGVLGNPERAAESVLAMQREARGCTWERAAERCVALYSAVVGQRKSAAARGSAVAGV